MSVYSLDKFFIKTKNNNCFMYDNKLKCNDQEFDYKYSYNKIGDKLNKYHCTIIDNDENAFDGNSFTSCYWACVDAFNKRN